MIDVNQDEQSVYGNVEGIARIIGTPSDIPLAMQETFFPFMNKIMMLSNLERSEILNLLDELELKRIYMKNQLTEDEFEAYFDSEMFVQLRAYLRAALSGSKDGFNVKRLTTVYRHETLDTSEGRRGGFFGMFGGSKQ